MTPAADQGPHRAARAADADALRRERALLLDRAACARHASTALAESVVQSCATSAATRAAVAHDRLVWRVWRAGLAAIGWTPLSPAGTPILRVCMECEAVCFTPSQADRGTDADRGAAEVWVQPPLWVREHLRGGWRGPALSHGVCARCEPRFLAGLDDTAVAARAEPRPPAAGSRDAGARDAGSRDVGAREAGTREAGAREAEPTQGTAALLLHALEEIDAAAAALAVRMPWLDEDTVVEEVMARAVAGLARELPPDELRTFVGSLRAIVRALRRPGARDGDRSARAARAPGPARAPDHFRPRLRGP
jgi:hypothetical protein